MSAGNLIKLKKGSYVCVNDKIKKTINLYKDCFGIILKEINGTNTSDVIISKDNVNFKRFYYVYYKGLVLITTDWGNV